MLLQARVAMARRRSYEPEANALFARMTTQPSAARKTLINECIKSLKNSGVWAKLNALYLLAALDSQASALNWISTNYNITPTNGPTFTIDRGWQGTLGTSASQPRLDTNLNGRGILSNVSHHFSVFYQSAYSAVYDQWDGVYDGSREIIFAPNRGGQAYFDSLSPTLTAVTAGSNTSGKHFVLSRTSATFAKLYVDGAALANTQTGDMSASQVPNVNINLMGYLDTGSWHTHGIREAAASIGAGLSATEVSALTDAIHTYLAGVGAA